MEMTSSEWLMAIGQTVLVTGGAFVLLCAITSLVRFQLMTEAAREAEELGAGEEKSFRLSVLNQIATARRERQPISIMMLRIPEGPATRDQVEALLKSHVRSGDVVMACGDRLLGLLVLCGSEKTAALAQRLAASAGSGGVKGSEAWHFGVAGYPEHGTKTSELYPRAMSMLDDEATAKKMLIAGMADAASVAEEKKAPEDQVDPLTGLINEEKMINVMRRFIAQERRAERAVSMVYFMVDQLDRSLHAHGEKNTRAMIKELSEIIALDTRESDILARFDAGGFILSMPAGPEEAMMIAQRIITDVRKHAFVAGNGMKVSISAGVAGYPDVMGSAVQYFVAAEAALKQAHVRGRSQCMRYDASMAIRTEHNSIEQHL